MRIGLLGGGQLGRMIALAGYPLGLRFRVLDLSAEAPAGHLAELMVADFNDTDALKRFAAGLDLVTYEFENVPVDAARFLARRVPVYPPPQALEVAQDRIAEKTFFDKLQIPTPRFLRVDSWDDLRNAISSIGFPAVLKTRRYGYDGKGQFVIEKAEDAGVAWQSLGGVPLILEGFVAFEREVSIIAVRSRAGDTAFYTLVENHHQNGILRLSLSPAPGADSVLQGMAEDYASRVLTELNYVGVLAIEFFQREGELLANEMAPRVHNSGHWSIEGAQTSQFENHLRAILGLPLGSSANIGFSAMINLIGTVADRRAALSIAGAHLHLYGKQARPNRKVGHITVRAQTEPDLYSQLAKVRSLLEV